MTTDPPPDTTTRAEQERRRRFAEAIARAEFGRFYWNDELEERLRSGSAGSKRKRNRPDGDGKRK